MGRKLPKVLTTEEQERFLAVFNTRYPAPHRDLCMIRLMLEAGLRAGEVVALKPEHLDMMTCRLMVRNGKGAKDRTLWIGDNLRDLIGEWIQRRPESAYLFPSRTGKKLDTSHLRYMVARRAEAASISEAEQVSPHTFRHTFATDLYRETKNIRLVQKALGHADLSTTMIYTHIVDDELEDAMRCYRDWMRARSN